MRCCKAASLHNALLKFPHQGETSPPARLRLSLTHRVSCCYNLTMNDTDIERFVEAQNTPYNSYPDALAEICNGRKYTHWVWYIFPQLRGLGYSHNAHFYGISGREEARRYLQHPVLGERLREISRALLQHKDLEAEAILGGIDAMKVRSCMTLFDAISPGDVFADVLDTFYAGSRCESTLSLLANTPL